MIVSLNKALKRKNELAGQINKLKTRITKNNSLPEGSIKRFDTMQMIKQLQKLRDDLVAIKTAIAIANVPIYEKINLMAEYKGEIEFLDTIDTKEGEINEGRFYGEDKPPVKYAATITADTIVAWQQAHEREISKLQDEIDTFNHTTTVEIPG